MTEQSTTLFEPRYAKQFQCIGSQCEDHCCHTWDVVLDKKSFKAYKKSKHPVLKKLFDKNLKLLRTNDKQYGKINIKPHCDCPFLGSDSLCEIQKHAGHQALSNTCKIYPRSTHYFNGTVERSLSLSCPEAARKILLDPSAFMIDESEIEISDLHKEAEINIINNKEASVWLPIVKQVCFDILLCQDMSAEQRLMTIGLFIKQAEPILTDSEKLLSLTESFYTMIGNHEFDEIFNKLETHAAHLWHIFTTISNYIVGEKLQNTIIAKTYSRSDARFLLLHETFVKALGGDKQDDEVGNFVSNAEHMTEKIIEGYESNYLDFFSDKQHMLTNYLIYYIYHYMFPLHQKLTPFKFYRLFVIDFFMLKTYLCGLSFVEEGLSEAMIVQLFQSYARKRQHTGFEEEVDKILDNLDVDPAAAVFGLLNFSNKKPNTHTCHLQAKKGSSNNPMGL